MNGAHVNAVAGPSRSSPTPVSPVAPSTLTAPHPPQSLFLPPPGPSPPRQHLTSTQDLLARFQLLSAYDTYVRPFVTPASNDAPNEPSSPMALVSPGGVDKGKGRDMGVGVTSGVGHRQDAVDGDDEDGTGKGEKKKKNSYKHLIKGLPGKHSMKKDDYLANIMRVPPKQRIPITQFDLKTQRDAFTVSLEGLKGWNTNALVQESAQAREDRKKRKELKRLAKAQQVQGFPGQPTMAHTGGTTENPQPIQAPIPTSASASSYRPPGTSTPRPTGMSTPVAGSSTPHPVVANVGTPRPGSATSNVPRLGSAVPRPGSTVPRPGSTVARPGSIGPRPGSTVPRTVSAPAPLTGVKPPTTTQRAGTPMKTTGPPSAVPIEQRGIKREWEDGGVGGALPLNGVGNGHGSSGYNASMNAVNGTTNGTAMPPKAVINAKAGNNNVRPRPVKKQRMDMQGQARDVSAPVQQPTPQGV